MEPALTGIRIVEQGTFITGPCAGMLLADLGADVIKIESPDGDPYRAYQGSQYSRALPGLQPQQAQPGAEHEAARATASCFSKLIREADVYIQNFRPGAAERIGAGPEQLLKLNPRLVYCSISGFGATGPYAERPSYDSVAQALSGFLSVVVDYRRPQFLGPALADAITGMYAAQGILAALVRRGSTGRGRACRGLDARGHGAFCGRALRRLLCHRARRRLPRTGRDWRRPTSCARRMTG